eukprot:CAMPEP_0184502442 /NCGR_PEP_ID=MMETSP0113_2-20130426/50369_1 /TAXON_ID=91329 /ORGANISM="Norrisiella sphaerica, Strain BC52" /LENGTH=220 /DNA_ID=CAMNT_0026891627 /DNA_START=63 /DNA_END=725 /DNA_ORIENTATION=+
MRSQRVALKMRTRDRSKEDESRPRRAAIIIRGKRVFEYDVPTYLPKWLQPEFEAVDVFDDPMGDFEPTFGTPMKDKDAPSLSSSTSDDQTSNITVASGVHLSPNNTTTKASSPETRRQERLQGSAGRQIIYDWSLRSQPNPISTRIRRQSNDSDSEALTATPNKGKATVTTTPTAVEKGPIESLGRGGVTVLGLYTLAFVMINLLGLLEDLRNADPFSPY